MSTCFYNTVTEQFTGPYRPGPYLVDGKPGTLPPDCVEIAIVEEPFPEIPAGKMAQRAPDSLDLTAKTLTRSWTLVDAPPVHASKETVVRRIRAAGKLTEMRALLASMTANQQFEFTHLTTLDPSRADLRAGITQLGLDPDVILAP